MKRIWFSMLATVSLAISIAVAALWVHGHFALDGLHLRRYSYSPPNQTIRQIEIWSVDGELWISIHTSRTYPIAEEQAAMERDAWDHAGLSKKVSWSSDPTKGYPFNPPWWSHQFPKRWGFTYEPIAHTANWDGQIVRDDFQQFGLPHWSVLVVFLFLPICWLGRRIRKYRRAAANLCRNCGYDLRATPERCPECGTVPVGR